MEYICRPTYRVLGIDKYIIQALYMLSLDYQIKEKKFYGWLFIT